ncbi:MAG: efflux RND transporter permease subunit, partial [Planctomycetota bacterium]
MNPVAFAVDRFRLTLIAVAGLLIMGAFSYVIIPRREDPLIQVNGATVFVRYPGAGPADVERHVTKPLEERISEIQDVDQLISSSSRGAALIVVRFDADSDMAENLQELREQVKKGQAEMPDEAEDPEIVRWESETVSMILNLGGPLSDRDLHFWAKFVKRELEKIPQIRALEIEGEQEREVRVEVDQRRLSQYGLSLDELVGRIRAENISLPAGHMDLGRRRFLVRTDEEYDRARAVARTIVAAWQGRTVFLEDVATVREASEEPDYLVFVNGKQSVNVLVRVKPRANLLEVSEEVRRRVAAMEDSFPADLEVAFFFDQAIGMSGMLGTFQWSLVLGTAVIVLLTFLLMNFRMAFIVAFVLPLSCAFAIIMLFAFGHTLNQITLASLIIVLGMLVDNGIVVVE